MNQQLVDACMNNDLRKVQEAVENSAQSLFQRDADGRIPLHWAVSFNHKEIILYILSYMKEAQLDEFRDNSGWTAFHIACAVGDIDVVSELYDRMVKPDLDLQTNQGVTALHLAVSKKHINICEFLLDHGASVRIKDKKLQLPLHRAAATGSPVLVELLCNKKSPVNAVDINGWSPLFHAMAEGHGDIAVLLVNKYDANDQIEDPRGLKPIDYALNEQVKKYFQNHVL